MVCVLVQVDKDIRHPLVLEQPSLHAAISSWHADFELQEIFRKGKTQLALVFMLLSSSTSVHFLPYMMFLFCAPAQISNLRFTVYVKIFTPGICNQK